MYAKICLQIAIAKRNIKVNIQGKQNIELQLKGQCSYPPLIAFSAQASAPSDQLITLRCQLSQLKQLKEVAAVGSRRSTRPHSRRSTRWQSRLVIFFTTYKSRR